MGVLPFFVSGFGPAAMRSGPWILIPGSGIIAGCLAPRTICSGWSPFQLMGKLRH